MSTAPVYPSRPDVPPHVPPALAYEYDIYRPGPRGSDFFEELLALKRRAPPIFWTPYNGGHWYTTDGALADQVFRDNVRFSSRTLQIPRENNPPLGQGFPPMHLDPPDHAEYRKLLLVGLSRKTVIDMIPGIRQLAIDLIEEMKPRGRCDFMTEFAFQLPVIVFLRLVDLPEKYFDGLRSRVTALVDAGSDKARLFRELGEHVAPFVDERLADPGDDLISWLSRQEVHGQLIAREQLHRMTTLLLIAGLDTVANTFGFFARHLADHPEQRRWLRENPHKMSGAIEELLRRYPVVIAGSARECVEDVQLGEAPVRVADLILAPPAMINFDEQTYHDPLKVDFSRRVANVATFGRGPHRCVGASLARTELTIYMEEWLPRIPEFWVSMEEPPMFEPGVTVAYDRLILEWPTGGC